MEKSQKVRSLENINATMDLENVQKLMETRELEFNFTNWLHPNFLGVGGRDNSN